LALIVVEIAYWVAARDGAVAHLAFSIRERCLKAALIARSNTDAFHGEPPVN
jgi:hypothetical protein